MTGLVARSLIFILFFFVEVEVQATPVSWPKGCSFKSAACTLQRPLSSSWWTHQGQGYELHLAPGAIVRKKGPGHYHLVEGRALLKSNGSQLQLGFPSGAARVLEESELHLEVLLKEKVTAQVAMGRVALQEGRSSFYLEAGFQASKNLKLYPSYWSVPRALNLQVVLKERAAAGRSAEEASLVSKAWAEAARRSSLLSADLVKRSLAAEEESLQRAQQEAWRREQEDRELREIFRKKHHLDF